MLLFLKDNLVNCVYAGLCHVKGPNGPLLDILLEKQKCAGLKPYRWCSFTKTKKRLAGDSTSLRRRWYTEAFLCRTSSSTTLMMITSSTAACSKKSICKAKRDFACVVCEHC